jgi:hypothetical protein
MPQRPALAMVWMFEHATHRGGCGDVARGEVEVLAVPLPRALRERGHQRPHRFLPHLTLVAHAPVERMQLDRTLALAEPQLHAATGEQVERGHALGHADGVIGGQLDDPVPEADATRALAGGTQEHFGGRAVRVLLQEVVLDGPRVIEAELIGQLDLGQRVLQHLVLALLTPRPGNLHLVENSELHARSPLPAGAFGAGATRAYGRPVASARRPCRMMAP